MKVLVMGSYRPQEGQYDIEAGLSGAFRKAAFVLGKGLAEGGHDLLIGWSHNNYLSQLGVKRQGQKLVTRHPKSHPYWETADYHALRGFLSILHHYPTARTRKRVYLETAGASDEFDDPPPFGPIALLETLKEAPLKAYAPAIGEALAADFMPDEAIHILDPAIASAIDIRRRGVESNAMRQELLTSLTGKADAVIMLGGGKASLAAARAANARKLIILDGLRARGDGPDHAVPVPSAKLVAAIDALGGEGAKLVDRARAAAMRLPELLAAAKADGAAIPFANRSFQAASAFVLAGLLTICFIVWTAAEAKSAPLFHTGALLLFAIATFAVTLWLTLGTLFDKPLKLLPTFMRTVAAGILALGATLSLMADGLGFIPPRTAVADAPLGREKNEGNASSAKKAPADAGAAQ